MYVLAKRVVVRQKQIDQPKNRFVAFFQFRVTYTSIKMLVLSNVVFLLV